MKRRLDLFVFDLAGTTVVDDDHVLRSFLQAASAFDLPVTREELQSRMGWHKVKVFASLLRERGRDPEPAPAMAAQFEVEFAALAASEPLRPTLGAQETLAALEAGGVKVAFNTGFTRNTANVVLDAMGWQDRVSVASDEVTAGRPAADLIQSAMAACQVDDPARVGVAGDTPADLLAGKAANAGMVVGLGCGTHSLDELREHPHTHLLDDLTTLPSKVFGND
ncbi:MAG: phosphonatase-like hydrolase [Planctomycetota bacterium]|jgi:phosphonatase-like hydrolase